ncbi:MAG: M61 family metallopeptidase [Candidatus Kapabacteria bacterium]|nr:M61 family metallopeptidase [Candidatus Kapabacteria bacterium]
MYSIEQRDEQVFGTTSQIRYHLHFERAPQHLLVVEMEIDTTEQQLTLVMPSWTPGSYKIREFVAHQGNLHVQDNQGNNLPYEWKTKNILSITSNGSTTVKVRYTYYANERTVRTMHINRWRAFIMPVNCLMYVDGRMNEVHHVYLHHNTQEWKQVSTALSPVTHESNPVIVGALNYDVLADSPIEIGNHQVQSFEVCGAKHEVALVAPLELDIDWLTQQCQVIVETEAQIFGGVPYDRYVFMVQVGMNVYGGLEHSRCSVNLVDIGQMTDKGKAGTLLALLCHEFFHTWNIKRIRPVEYGPFDYINECYSPMLWLAEGFTSYYDDLLSYRCGFMNRDEYISALGSDHLAKLERVPGRKAMNTRDASFLAWVKLYAQSPDGNNRHPSYYLKGGIITLMIELYIIAQTNGTKRLDDVMRELWKMYLERPEQGVTEQEVYSAISTSTGIDCAALLSGMLHGTDDIDYNKFLAPFGLEWTSDITVSPKVFAGMNTKDDGGKVVITSLEDDAPAALCGLSIDDEILAVNGLRVTSTGGFAELLQRNGTLQPAQILASCDGKVFEVQLTPSAKQEYRLVVKNTITEEQRTLLNYWLER